MKKLFISQPMRGKTDEEILSERDYAISRAECILGEKVEVIDTFFQGFNGKPLEALGKSISMLADADIAYFASGWSTTRGCRIEHECAVEYGIETMGENA